MFKKMIPPELFNISTGLCIQIIFLPLFIIIQKSKILEMVGLPAAKTGTCKLLRCRNALLHLFFQLVKMMFINTSGIDIFVYANFRSHGHHLPQRT